jgi:putative ABC transport system permease protein
MSEARRNSRPMFWRIVRRLVTANRGRLIVILLALAAGAAVTAALLNIQVDAKRRLTTEFRTLGANIIVAPHQPSESESLKNATLDQSLFQRIPSSDQNQNVHTLAVLYVSAMALASANQAGTPIVVAGEYGDSFHAEASAEPSKASWYGGSFSTNTPSCVIGDRAAARLGKIKVSTELTLRNGGREEVCRVDNVRSKGGPEDDQVAVPLDLAQRLAALPGKISVIQISAAGTPSEIQKYISNLQLQVPEADVHGIRQFTEAEGKIYNRISGLLTATVAVVLILTMLCVMAAMTNVAMERKNDVGLMKAIGGATRRVLRLFLAEAAVLGLIGGILGAAAGILISIGLGKAVFGVAAQPRMIVYPVAVALTMVVSLAGAYPLRRLASIRPASVFRGE